MSLLTLLAMASACGSEGATISPTTESSATVSATTVSSTTGSLTTTSRVVPSSTAPPQSATSGITPDVETEALTYMAEFVSVLRAGDEQGAAVFWSGYPNSDDERQSGFDEFIGQFSWIADNHEIPEMFVVPAFGWGHNQLPIVVLQSRSENQAAAFLLGDSFDGTGMEILRLPGLPRPDAVVSSGAEVQAGAEITFPFVPVEGAARAFIDSQEIESVIVDHEALTTTVALPDSLQPGPAVLTLSVATPEYPTSDAVGITIVQS